FAPTSTVTAARLTAPIPRFIDTSSPAPLASIVSCAAPAVSTVSASPNTGSGTTQDFTFQYSDSTGASNISVVWAWFNPAITPAATNSCMVYYNRTANTLNLAGDSGQRLSGTLGSTAVLQNSQCSVNLAGASTVINGNILTLHVPVNFQPG